MIKYYINIATDLTQTKPKSLKEMFYVLDSHDKFTFVEINQDELSFRSGRSTLSLLHSLKAKIIENLNNTLLSILILFDFSKGFDTLAHDILIL